MALVGTVALLIALVLGGVSCALLLVTACLRVNKPEIASTLGWLGRICTIAVCGALTICCGVLVICFLNGDNSILYVVKQRSDSSGDLAWLYKIAGLWAGREGSLLFWAWLIACFNSFMAWKTMETDEKLDDWGIGIAQFVELAFLMLLFFSESNMPFIATPGTYFDVNGRFVGEGMVGMNMLLEHWAMAVHPPTLFIGYAGLTVPFAYAIAALIVGDGSSKWVVRVNGVTSFAWLFLGVGIGLGAVWAYVVLGWGGYWGWDPVENASLLSWLVCTALMHSFTVYRTRGGFKRWSLVCACFAFMFVIVGTFISRSGVVQSVHAFSGDQVSLVLFMVLIMVSAVAGICCMFARRKAFSSSEGLSAAPENDVSENITLENDVSSSDKAENDGRDAKESIFSMEMGYFLNNLILVVGAFALAYLTLAPAFPGWMPLGGQSIGADAFNSLARPLSMALLLIVAIGPLLGWRHTDAKQFWKRARVPGICALVLFAMLMVYFALVLLPAYAANISAGTLAAEELAAMGPGWYYNGLAIIGFAIASVLIFNGLFLFAKAWSSIKSSGASVSTKKQNGWNVFRKHASTIGGMLTHASLGVLLIGLIGSSMYVTEVSGYLAASSVSKADTELHIQDYVLKAVDADSKDADGDGYLYTVTLDITKGEEPFAQSKPMVQMDPYTKQQKLVADVISEPLQDLFVVFRGLNTDDDISMDVRVNPLISFVWVGFGLFIVGNVIACLAKRPVRRASVREIEKSISTGEVNHLVLAGEAVDSDSVKEGEEAEETEDADRGVSANDTMHVDDGSSREDPRNADDPTGTHEETDR